MLLVAQNYSSLVVNTLNGVYCHNISNYSQNIKKIVNAVYINNLTAYNWYYGSTTQTQYVSFLRKMSTKHKLTPCPLDKPFVRPNQNVCFNCPSSSIYNIGTQNCDSCPPGQVLDID